MKRTAQLLIWTFAFGYASAQDVTCNDAGNQLELNACAADEFKRADAELNEAYAALLHKERGDLAFIEKLRAAQRAWLEFREAEVEATYACNEENPRACWGSMLPMSISAYKAKLTRERTARLVRIINEGRPAN